MTYEDLLRIIELVKQSEQWSEFHLKVGDLEVDFKRASLAAPGAASTAPQATQLPAATARPHRTRHVGGGEIVSEPPSSEGARTHSHQSLPLDHSAAATLVKSPMVGTFYRAPEPGAPPFVDVGSEVSDDTIVCIIEVMKLMNSIPGGARGVVTQILVADAEPVEYGQVLMVIEPR
jgi:acetyl-CoA carboxylase biotin carboxyl carrier protein